MILVRGYKLVLFIAVFVFVRSAAADLWHANVNELRKGDVFKTNVYELHPAQFTLGFSEVDRQAKKLSSLSKVERREKDKNDPVPVIIGPGDKLFIIDGHHSVAAHLKVAHPKIFAKVVEDWRSMTPDFFWKTMIEHNFVYLFDEQARGPLSPYDLPASVDHMKDDPYRSLAGLVRRSGGYEKTGQPFEEFIWANYFRATEAAYQASRGKTANDDSRVANFAALARTMKWVEARRSSEPQPLSGTSCLKAFDDE